MNQRFRTGIAFLIMCLLLTGCTKTKKADQPRSPSSDATGATGGPRALPDPRRAAPAAGPADQKAVVQGANRFALDLYARVRAKPGNTFVSPWSITTALAMTWAGARTETAAQMKKVMHYPLDQAGLHKAFGAMESAMEAEQKTGGYRLSIANRIWPRVGIKLSPAFLKTLADNYGARPQVLDYKKDLEGSRKTINRWVASKTADKIKELLKPPDLTPAVQLVLTNAIYFKGKWARRFKKKATRKAAFHVSPGKTVQVDMMHQTAKFKYTETPELQALVLTYKGNRLSMLVVLPKQKDGLAELEKKLNGAMINRLSAGGLGTRKVKVYLPRFKIRSRFKMAKTLQAMGMHLPFQRNVADFSGMLVAGKKGDLMISEVIHEAVCEVDEEGTVAAAATAVVVVPGGAPPRIAVFKADHPSLIFLHHHKSGAILFMGRVTNPTGG